MKTATQAWCDNTNVVMMSGLPTESRGMMTREILAYSNLVDMRNPIMTYRPRKLNYQLMLAEACWILDGSSMLDHHPAIRKAFAPYSDDSISMAGAYGPQIMRQLPYIRTTFARDLYSRQAIIEIWKPVPMISKDIPCTLSMQFIVRKCPCCEKKTLHTMVSMRSSDVWLGLPYDIFSFSMVSYYLLLYLREFGILDEKCILGGLHILAGSSHIYERDVEKVKAASIELSTIFDDHHEKSFTVAEIDCCEILYAQTLLEYLKELRDVQFGKRSFKLFRELKFNYDWSKYVKCE